MATTKEYKNYLLEELDLLDNIVCKPMMGEYLLYYNGVLFGGIYDNRLLVKILNSNKKYHMQEAIPYDNAKPMYLVDCIDNKELLKEIVLDTCNDLIKNDKKVNKVNETNNLFLNLDKIHTTKLGEERIKRNLDVKVDNIVNYCIDKIKNKNTVIYRVGKNYYCEVDDIIITINVGSYTIITAHKLNKKIHCR